MRLRFPLGDDLLESTLYLVLALLPSFELSRESSPQAQSRNHRLQQPAVKFLRKRQRDVFSPGKAILSMHRPMRQRNLQTKPDLVSGLIIVRKCLIDRPRGHECSRHETLHLLPMKKCWIESPWVNVHYRWRSLVNDKGRGHLVRNEN